MSVRRLAEDNIQPAAFKFNKDNAAWAEKKIKDFPKGREASAVIPLLMRAQEQEGWVTRASIEYMAEMLNMPYIRVMEVATFYTQFQLKPVGSKAHIQVCGTTPCMLRGSGDLIKVCKNKINKEPFKTNEAGTLSWEEVECLGSCVNAPMIMVFKDTYEDLTAERLDEIIDLFEADKGSEVPVGTQIDRFNSAPIGGFTALLEDPTKSASNGAEQASAAVGLVSIPDSKAAAKKAIPAKSKKSTAKTSASKPVDEPARIASLDDKDRPAAIDRPADPDDLKKISGIGPKIEGTLNGLGIYQFEQIAGWQKPECDWVDGYLSFKGRIEREEWIPQARGLMKSTTGKSAGVASLDHEDRPQGIERPAEIDDLKVISGIGPKIEGILHELGIFTFEQIGKWKKAECDWVDDYLSFKGRIERDDWVKQAKVLATGDREEYVRQFGKEPR